LVSFPTTPFQAADERDFELKLSYFSDILREAGAARAALHREPTEAGGRTPLSAGAEEQGVPDPLKTLGRDGSLNREVFSPPVILESAWTTSLRGWGTYS